MTSARKQELEKRAKKLYRLIWDSDLILSDLTDALEQVEHEVWEKAETHFTAMALTENHLTPDERIGDGSVACFERAAQWCREQGGA